REIGSCVRWTTPIRHHDQPELAIRNAVEPSPAQYRYRTPARQYYQTGRKSTQVRRQAAPSDGVVHASSHIYHYGYKFVSAPRGWFHKLKERIESFKGKGNERKTTLTKKTVLAEKEKFPSPSLLSDQRGVVSLEMPAVVFFLMTFLLLPLA